jgi:hypothetical protein
MLVLLALVGCKPTPHASATAPPTRASSSASSSVSPSPVGKPSPKHPAGATPASAKDGTYANQLSISEDGALSFMPLRWYAGSNAAARCREKGIKPELAWCSDYYYEKAGPRQSAALTEDTKVWLLNDDLKPIDATLTQLVDAVEAEVWPNFQIAVVDGKVVRISQVFTP